MDLVLILGLGMTAVTLAFAGRRVLFLGRLITSGQPAPDRLENVTKRLGESLKTQVVEVFAQKKLLKWSVPGAAHFFVFWAFLILRPVYLEAYGALFDPELPHPDHRHLAGPRLRAGLHRRDGPGRHRDLRRHPAEALPGRLGRKSRFRARTSAAPGWSC